MGLGGSWDTSSLSKAQQKQADNVLETAINAGIRHFDHADIYTFGKAEQAFGSYLKKEFLAPRKTVYPIQNRNRFKSRSFKFEYL